MAEAEWLAASRRGRWARVRVATRLAADHGVTLVRAWLAELAGPRVARAGWADRYREDFRYAWRGLSRTPGFLAVAVAIIGLGVGATTTIISVGNGLFLRVPAGIARADELVTVHEQSRDGSSFHSFSYLDYRDLAREAGDGIQLAAYNMFAASVVYGAEPEATLGLGVTGNYFSVLGAVPHLGRLLAPADDQGAGSARVAVLSYGTWQRRFAADSSLVGRRLTVNGEPYTIVGIAEPGFGGHVAAFDSEVWVPVALSLGPSRRAVLDQRRSSWLEIIGRATGAGLPAVTTRLSAISTETGRAAGLDWDRTVDVRRYSPVPAQIFLPILGFLGLLLLLGSLILLISSTNIAGVMVARAVARGRETAVRLAIGANRWVVIRHLLAENLLLFLFGGVAGTAFAWVATRLISRIELPFPVPLRFEFPVDGRVLAVAFGVSLLTGIGFGLMPALQATRASLAGSLRDHGSDPGAGRFRLRAVLVTAQVAASALLIVVASLFVRALDRAQRLDLGFEPANVRVVGIEFSVLDYQAAEVRAFAAAFEERARTLPGVRQVGATDVPPLTLANQTSVVSVEGRPRTEGVGYFGVDFARVTPGYFGALSIPIVRGRGFSEEDRSGAPAVMVINEALAGRLWPGEDPVGRVIHWGQIEGGPPVTIVGVVPTGKYRSLGEDPRDAVFLPAAQDQPRRLSFVLKTDRLVPGFSRTVAEAVRALDPNLAIATNDAYPDLIGLSLLPSRIAAWLAGGFALVGLVLSTMGLYGVLSYLVVRRRRELGIRLALGAEAGLVRRLVLREGVRLTVVGLGLGVGGAMLLARALRSFLFGLDSVDPLVVMGASGLLLAAAALACDLPARRAAAMDPVEVLRDD
ncbi:MAG: ADOP family duplicated permease [Gemmatimonadales bacterium]